MRSILNWISAIAIVFVLHVGLCPALCLAGSAEPTSAHLEDAGAPEEAPWGQPGETNHLWMGVLPANPPLGMTVLHVRAVDHLGDTFTGRRLINIE